MNSGSLLVTLALLICLTAPRSAAAMDHGEVVRMVENGDSKMLQLLIFEPGELSQIENDWGESLIHLAVKNNHPDIVVWLLQNHIDVNQRNNSDQTPLALAPATGNPEMIDILRQNGADILDVDSDHGTLLHAIAAHGNREMITAALGLGLDLNRQDDSKHTPLMRAAEQLNEDTVGALLEHGPLLDVQNTYGETALYKAAESYAGWDDAAKYRVVETLLNAGANPDIPDDYGRYPCTEVHSWSLYYLLAKGTARFQMWLWIALSSATVLTLIPVLIWRGAAKKPAPASASAPA